MNKKRKLVVISHDASLSGAPVLLLNLLKLLKATGQFSICVFIKRGGPLNERFRQFDSCCVLKPANYLQGNLISKLIHVAQNRIRLGKALWASKNADYILSNTITNGRLLSILSKITHAQIISYVHELKDVARQMDKLGDVSLTIKSADKFYYPSQAVSTFLTQQYNISDDRKFYLPYYFPVEQETKKQNKSSIKNTFAQQHGLNENDCWVVGMGTIAFRKGIDYFIDTAAYACKHQLPVSFIWIGGFENEEMEAYVKNRLKEVGNLKLYLVGQLPYNLNTIAPFDIFFLSSREDPYPLVVLEAAYNEVPSICFKDAGGIQEFLQDGCGWIIPRFDPSLVADQIRYLIDNKEIIEAVGRKARERTLKWHSDKKKIVDSFLNALSKD